MIFKTVRRKISTIPSYIKGNRLGYGLRLYLRKSLKVPVIIKTIRGANIYLGFDLIDDIILKDLNVGLANVYFPPGLDLIEGDIVWDVGGHHGIFAMELAANYPGIRIFSFEPDINSSRYFKFNRFLNRNTKTQLVDAALDVSTNTAYIVKSIDGSWGNFVQKESIEGSRKIKTRSISDVLDFYDIKVIKYAKFNAEGAEFVVLPELFRLNVFPNLILLFVHPEKGDVDNLIHIICSNSYKLERCHTDKNRPWYLFRFVKYFA